MIKKVDPTMPRLTHLNICIESLQQFLLGFIPDDYLGTALHEIVILERGQILFLLLLRRLPIHSGSLQVELLVRGQMVGEHIPHGHHVVLYAIHSESVHTQVLGEQGLAMPLYDVLEGETLFID
jgi:hypothetical protein